MPKVQTLLTLYFISQEGQQRGCGSSRTPPTHLLGDGDENNHRFDGTGLLVWPGSRLLASFLADPLGARRIFPHIFTSGLDYRGTTRSTASERCGANSMGSSRPSASGHCEQRDGLRCVVHGDHLTSHKDVLLDDGSLPGKNRETAPSTGSARETARGLSAILELGAGTGVCGIAASLNFGCPVGVSQVQRT